MSEDPAIIAVLDDEPDRVQVMRRQLSKRLANYEHVFFDNAPDLIEWLVRQLNNCALICLDHDLGPNRIRDGQTFDPGTGRDVADYLSGCRPQCPIVIHTTNADAAPGMERVLQESGWQTIRVIPFDDLAWIRGWWIREIQAALR